MAVNDVVYKAVPKNEISNGTPQLPTPRGFGMRHLQAFLIFMSLVIIIAVRYQLSVLMVAMTKHDHYECNITQKENGSNNSDGNCHRTQDMKGVYRTYDWNKSTQEIITFTFFVGYTSMQVPMGLIAQKIGGKIPIMVALAVNGLLSIGTPWISMFGGWIGVSFTRLIQGMTQAAFYPSIHTLLAKWSPLSERGRLSTYIYSGSQAGTILAFQVSGLVSGTPAWGWPSSFWLFGTLSLLMCCLFGWLGAASPHELSRISSEEIAFITEGANSNIAPIKRKTPWREILKCPAIWGLFITQAGSSTSYILVMTEIPHYMSGVLGVDIKRNGLYSSLPYVASYVMGIVFGVLTDFASNRKIMKIVNIRRTANTIGMVMCGIFLIAFSFVNNTLIAVILLVISLGLHSAIHVGFHINQIDLAPNFAGSIMAFGNMIAHMSSLLVPVVVSSILKDVTNRRQWQMIFVIVAAMQFVTNAIYVIFAKGEVQPWNFYGEEGYDKRNDPELIAEKKIVSKNGFSHKEEIKS